MTTRSLPSYPNSDTGQLNRHWISMGISQTRSTFHTQRSQFRVLCVDNEVIIPGLGLSTIVGNNPWYRCGSCRRVSPLSLSLSNCRLNWKNNLFSSLAIVSLLAMAGRTTEWASVDSPDPYYESANATFARCIANVYRTDDLIWVHDYHILLVPK